MKKERTIYNETANIYIRITDPLQTLLLYMKKTNNKNYMSNTAIKYVTVE
jgi:hypothetical protein